MLNKLVSVCLLLAFCITLFPVKVKGAGVSVSAASAILMIAETGEVIYEKNAHERRGMASTTKIMTCLVALENSALKARIRVSRDDIAVEGTSIGLRYGDFIDMHTLVKGMLLESGNDAANVTASLVGGGREAFVSMMNDKAKELGMKNTNFKNPSGLTEEGHYSTAFDMALLSREAIKNPYFASICSEKSMSVYMDNSGYARTFHNHNKFLGMYEGAKGIKTGFTKASGRCLITAVEGRGVTLIAVTLNAPNDWKDHKKLMDYGFSVLQVDTHSPQVEGMKISVAGKSDKLALLSSGSFHIPYFKEKPSYSIVYFVPPFVYGGVKKGDYIGWAELQDMSGNCIDKVYLCARHDIREEKAVTKKGFSIKNIIF